MQGFQSIASMVSGDEIILSGRFEWSDDKVHVRLVQPWISNENPISYGGSMSASTPTMAKFVRLVVENGPNPQGANWAALVALLVTTPTGYVAPLCDFPEDSDPGQTVRAVMYGRRVGDVTPQYTQVLVDGNGALLPGEEILPTSKFDQRIPATLDSTLVTSISPELRDSMSIYNSSALGTMYVRLGADVDVPAGDWDYAVPPAFLWVCPSWAGDIYIAWDNDAAGYAHCLEIYG